MFHSTIVLLLLIGVSQAEPISVPALEQTGQLIVTELTRACVKADSIPDCLSYYFSSVIADYQLTQYLGTYYITLLSGSTPIAVIQPLTTVFGLDYVVCMVSQRLSPHFYTRAKPYSCNICSEYKATDVYAEYQAATIDMAYMLALPPY